MLRKVLSRFEARDALSQVQRRVPVGGGNIFSENRRATPAKAKSKTLIYSSSSSVSIFFK